MDIVSLIVQLISGAVGGNIAGRGAQERQPRSRRQFDRRRPRRRGLGGQLLGMLGAGAAPGGGGLDAASIISSIAGGGIGGGVLMAIIGLIRKQMVRS